MAHWAELDKNNIVIRILVGDNNDPNGDEGYQWLIDNLGGRWLKTSYNTKHNKHELDGIPFRKNYAGIGFYYDKSLDAFIPPKPFKSWLLDKEIGDWYPPVPYPEGKDFYEWNEDKQNWDLIELE